MNEDAVIKAFSKVKEDMGAINARLNALEAQIKGISEKLSKKNTKFGEFKDYSPSKGKIQESSSGNKGVQSINHSTINQSFNNQSLNQSVEYQPQIREKYDDKSKNMPTLSIQLLKKELESRFFALTNQEFLVFLTVYQLEEELNRPVTYKDLSLKLSLTTGCIRGYVSSLIHKNLPIIKSKINNRTLTLTINPEFRDLNLKEKLTNLYYNKDPEQTKLF